MLYRVLLLSAFLVSAVTAQKMHWKKNYNSVPEKLKGEWYRNGKLKLTLGKHWAQFPSPKSSNPYVQNRKIRYNFADPYYSSGSYNHKFIGLYERRYVAFIFKMTSGVTVQYAQSARFSTLKEAKNFRPRSFISLQRKSLKQKANPNNLASSMANGWRSLRSVPNWLYGSWEQNGTVHLSINSAKSVITYGGRQYRVISSATKHGDYLISTRFNGKYYGFFIKKLQGRNSISLHQSKGFTSSGDIKRYRSKNGFFYTYNQVNKQSSSSYGGTQGSSYGGSSYGGNQGSSYGGNSQENSQRHEWRATQFPKTLNAEWYTSQGVWNYSIKNNQIRTGNRFYNIVNTSYNNGIYRIVATLNNQFYAFFFRNVQGSVMEVSKVGAFSSYNDALNTSQGNYQFHQKKNQSSYRKQARLNWRSVGFPPQLNGNWYNQNGVWNYFIQGSKSIRTGNQYYNISGTYFANAIHKVITKKGNQYFTFYFKVLTQRSMQVWKSPAFYNFNDAKNVTRGSWTKHTKR